MTNFGFTFWVLCMKCIHTLSQSWSEADLIMLSSCAVCGLGNDDSFKFIKTSGARDCQILQTTDLGNIRDTCREYVLHVFTLFKFHLAFSESRCVDGFCLLAKLELGLGTVCRHNFGHNGLKADYVSIMPAKSVANIYSIVLSKSSKAYIFRLYWMSINASIQQEINKYQTADTQYLNYMLSAHFRFSALFCLAFKSKK